jgi:hypothetical protein
MWPFKYSSRVPDAAERSKTLPMCTQPLSFRNSSAPSRTSHESGVVVSFSPKSRNNTTAVDPLNNKWCSLGRCTQSSPGVDLFPDGLLRRSKIVADKILGPFTSHTGDLVIVVRQSQDLIYSDYARPPANIRNGTSRFFGERTSMAIRQVAPSRRGRRLGNPRVRRSRKCHHDRP